jgi:predicted nuclease of predicted toxin-antitoxin system
LPKPLRVLLDECLPKKLKRELPEHTVITVQEQGWSGKKNGELMKLARGQFDVFMAADQNLAYQQNVVYAEIGVVVLQASSNRIESLKPLMPNVDQVLITIKPGDIVLVQV